MPTVADRQSEPAREPAPSIDAAHVEVCLASDEREVVAELDSQVGVAGGVAADPTPIRMRVRFSKTGDLRLISHRDLVRSLERMFRRAGVEVRQSEGFHPKPRMMFPSALSLGIAGLDEVLEVDLAVPLAPAVLAERLSALVPPGLTIVSIEPVPPGARKASAKWLCYELAVPPERAEQAAPRIAELMASSSRPVARPGRAAPVDLRATILELVLEDGLLRMKLLAMREAQARPRDILTELNLLDLESNGSLVRTRVELDD